jgi:5-methylcytosine-specific restriction endonuclease McrA
LRVLSLLLEEAFPYHRNWKQSETHPAFWELYPTIDHIVPVARGGADDESNIVTISMVRNSTKSNWLLDEVGWSAQLAPVVPEWDGLVRWFDQTSKAHDRLMNDKVIKQWRKALDNAGVA